MGVVAGDVPAVLEPDVAERDAAPAGRHVAPRGEIDDRDRRRGAPVRRAVAHAVVAQAGTRHRGELEVPDQVAPGRRVDDARARAARSASGGRGRRTGSSRPKTPSATTFESRFARSSVWSATTAGPVLDVSSGTMSRAQVASPTTPFAVRPFAVWNVLTAVAVAGVNRPLTLVGTPCAVSRPWTARTSAPRSPRLWVGKRAGIGGGVRHDGRQQEGGEGHRERQGPASVGAHRAIGYRAGSSRRCGVASRDGAHHRRRRAAGRPARRSGHPRRRTCATCAASTAGSAASR